MEAPPLGKAISAAEESNDFCSLASGSSLLLLGGIAVKYSALLFIRGTLQIAFDVVLFFSFFFSLSMDLS